MKIEGGEEEVRGEEEEEEVYDFNEALQSQTGVC